MDVLKQERQRLTAEKKSAYKGYRAVRKDMQELVAAKQNIDYLFGLTDAQKSIHKHFSSFEYSQV